MEKTQFLRVIARSSRKTMHFSHEMLNINQQISVILQNLARLISFPPAIPTKKLQMFDILMRNRHFFLKMGHLEKNSS